MKCDHALSKGNTQFIGKAGCTACEASIHRSNGDSGSVAGQGPQDLLCWTALQSRRGLAVKYIPRLVGGKSVLLDSIAGGGSNAFARAGKVEVPLIASVVRARAQHGDLRPAMADDETPIHIICLSQRASSRPDSIRTSKLTSFESSSSQGVSHIARDAVSNAVKANKCYQNIS